MGFDIKSASIESEWYEPEWGGNKEQPEDERMRVRVRGLTKAGMRSFSGEAADGNDLAVVFDFVRLGVLEIKGLKIDGKDVKNGIALATKVERLDKKFSAPMVGLLVELAKEVADRSSLSEDEEKNFG